MIPYYKMTSFSNNSSIKNLPENIQDILINRFSGFALDLGTEFLNFETMTQLLQSRNNGLGALIISTDGKKEYLTEDQENIIRKLEMYFTEEDNDSPVPELEYYTADGERIEDIYLTAKNSGDIVGQRKAALKWIDYLSSCEFQKRLLDGTLPEFEIDTENSAPLERFNQGLCRLMTNEDHDNKEFNQGYLKRHLLRYISVEDFKMTYYEEFSQKMSIEETMKQIELETESKLIQGYKSGEIILPNVSDDGSATLKDPNKQKNLLQNIMAEGAKKFEAASGRPMSYSEMRQMWG